MHESGRPPPSREDLESLRDAIRSGEVLIVKERNPWGPLLVEGPKDVENRTWVPKNADNCWILVACSKNKPSRADLQDAAARLAACSGVPVSAERMLALSRSDGGAIVGAIRLCGAFKVCDPPSVWHNPPDWGWRVDRAVAFASRVLLDETDKFQTKVWLTSRPQYVSPLLAQLPL